MPNCQGLGASSLLSCVEHHLFPFPGCHLYAINTHHSRELRVVVAIRNKLLLITRKHNKLRGVASTSLPSPLSESPVDEFQYIRVGFLFKPLLAWPGGRLRPSTQSVIHRGCPTVPSPLGEALPVALGQGTAADGAGPAPSSSFMPVNGDPRVLLSALGTQRWTKQSLSSRGDGFLESG